MSKKFILCITTSLPQAGLIVERLKYEAFSNNDISVLFPDKSGTRGFAHQKGTKALEGAAPGAASGGVLGGALGWLTGAGALAIPGVGTFVAAGPLVAALSGAAVDVAVGGIAGALIGLGLQESEAKRYEAKIKKGNFLISVHTENSDEIKRAKEIFEEAGVEDISRAGESSTRDKATALAAR